MIAHSLLRIGNITADIAVANIDENVSRQQCILRTNTRRTLHQLDLRQLTQRNHRAAHRGNQHLRRDGLRIAAQFARITDRHIKALTAFDRGGDHLPAQRNRNNLEQITDRQSIARQRQTIGFNIQVIAAGNALGIGAGGTRHCFHHGFDLPGNCFDLIQIATKHFDADRCADAGRQHVGAVLDRHGPGVRDTGDLQRLIELGDQVVDRHTRAPFVFRF